MRKLIIKSAIALTEAQKAKLEKGLSANGAELKFEYVIDSIVGGIVIVDGDTQIDASHAKELNKIKGASSDLLTAAKGIAIKDLPKLLKSKLNQI
ncbi:MAG: F0F1 ATP synthase subunit delta, partial [Bacillota bacterium]